MHIYTNAVIHTMSGPIIENGFVAWEAGRLVAAAPMEQLAAFAFSDAETQDLSGAHICPGFVDAHCHIGMWEDSMDFEGADGNEDTDPVTPHLRAIDAINPFDRCFNDALRAGITTVVTGPGSANPIGGQFCALKTSGTCVDNMIVRAPCAMKFALGENPKSVYHGKGQAPVTRMGTAALIRETLWKAQNYKADWDNYHNDPDNTDKPDLDFKLEALLPLLRGEIPAKFHAHRADDIATALRIGKEFHIRVTIEHATDGHLICDLLKEKNIPVMVGPALCERSKIELKNASFDNYRILSEAGLDVAIITDHPVIPIEYLPLCAMLAVKSGMDRELALRAITYTAAKNCGILDRVGALAAGLDADLLVFDSHPLSFDAKLLRVIVSGMPAVPADARI